ncbi:hypothetical protein GCM10027167_43500 [Nocardia heshunensis]
MGAPPMRWHLPGNSRGTGRKIGGAKRVRPGTITGMFAQPIASYPAVAGAMVAALTGAAAALAAAFDGARS